MSANVWFEEVNKGLIAEVLNTVKVVSNTGERVPLPEDAVFVRKPDEDFKSEVFPCVSIYNRSYEHDRLRYDPIPVKGDINPNTKRIEMEETAVTFNLFYQIDFWARYQTDMDTMTRTWLARHFRHFNLKVTDDGGVERTCNTLAVGQIVKSDLVLNKERLFHSIANLEIWVELDDEIRYNMPVVITHDVDAKQKGDNADVESN